MLNSCSPQSLCLRTAGMEQREAALGCRQIPADGDFRSAGSSTKSAVSPGALMQSSGSQMNGGRLDQDDEESACGSQDSNSITDSDKSMQGDGLEEHEFSIKEANFTEGSLKLKIQTTKRPKKPPKNLENYICPPEIKITIRQPGDQRSCRPSNSKKTSKGDEKKKKVRGSQLLNFLLCLHSALACILIGDKHVFTRWLMPPVMSAEERSGGNQVAVLAFIFTPTYFALKNN